MDDVGRESSSSHYSNFGAINVYVAYEVVYQHADGLA